MSIVRLSVALILSASLIAGCQHVPPSELASARLAYEHARSGPAMEHMPAELHKAHAALEVAEQSFDKHPRSYRTRDLAYVAQRAAQKADALARIAVEQHTIEQSEADFIAAQSEIMKGTRAELQAAQAAGAMTAAELEGARAAQDAADKRTAEALAALASLKQDERGLVITLSGSVLFRSADATLLPAATTKLDQVAAALMETKGRSLVVEGHTDAAGDPAYNLELSQRRAEAVREYIVSQGYDAELIKAQGIGEAKPVADNDSPEGMANNRRVEIVVKR